MKLDKRQMIAAAAAFVLVSLGMTSYRMFFLYSCTASLPPSCGSEPSTVSWLALLGGVLGSLAVLWWGFHGRPRPGRR